MDSAHTATAGGKDSGNGAFLQALPLLAVFAAELGLFWLGTSRHYAWIYPRWNDQVKYLSDAYAAYAEAKTRGFAAGAATALGHESPQGALHAFLALLIFEVAGPSRTAALAVNLLAFVALQGATFLAVRRTSGSRALAWASVGLLAALSVPWSGGVGSAADFRLDWMAACAYGVALAVAILGNGFRSTRWAALLGIVVGAVMVTRFLTAVYFCLIFPAILVWLVSGPDRARRCGRLFLSGMIAVALSVHIFWRSRHLIYNYYWIGQVAGPERALRDAHMGPLATVAWFGSELLFKQVGWAAWVLALAAGAFLYLAPRKNPGEPAGPLSSVRRDAAAMALAFFAAPACVLLLHPAKAAQPLSIILPAVVWIILLSWIALARDAEARAVAATGVAVALAGMALFLAGQLRDPTTPGEVARYRSVNALDDFLYFRAEEADLVNPRVAVTWLFDGLNAESLQVAGFERHGRTLHFVSMLPTGLFENPPEFVMARLADSDFVCLVTRAPSIWPFDREMAAMLPQTSSWCAANLRHDGDLESGDFSVSVYERPGLERPQGATGVDMGAFLAAAQEGGAGAAPSPPAPPYIRAAYPVLWSVKADLRYAVKAAYNPLTFRGVEMPDAMRIDPETGEITGKFPHAGDFTLRIAVSNPRGSREAVMTFHVVDADWAAELGAPSSCGEGDPAVLTFSAFDAGGRLQFIDVTDITARKVLVRLTPEDDEKQTWHGRYASALSGEGMHRIIARFVRYDAAASVPYTYLDRECTIEVVR